jgi:hypothetical protein
MLLMWKVDRPRKWMLPHRVTRLLADPQPLVSRHEMWRLRRVRLLVNKWMTCKCCVTLCGEQTSGGRARCSGAHGVCTRVLSARLYLRRGTSYTEYNRATSWRCSGFMSRLDRCSIAVLWHLSIIGGLRWIVLLVEFLVHPGPNSELAALQ